MALCSYAHASNDASAEALAEKALHAVCEQMPLITDTSFSRGLAGLGWCINKLSELQLIEGDINDILYYVDAAVYRDVNSPDASYELSLMNGVCGYLAYALARLRNPYTDKHSAQYRLLSSAVRSLVDQSDRMISEVFPKLMKELHVSCLWEPPILFAELGIVDRMGLYPRKVGNQLERWSVEILGTLPYYHVNRLSWATALAYANANVQKEYFDRHIATLLKSVSMEEMNRECSPMILNVNEGAPLFNNVTNAAIGMFQCDVELIRRLRAFNKQVSNDYFQILTCSSFGFRKRVK